LFAPVISKLANLSFSKDVFPARVFPLLKKSNLDPSDPSNYRPISNLSTFSKIFERLASNRILTQVTSSLNLAPFQSVCLSS
ncbi:hypothetical protein HELRODRAFT_81202, partial [Helobdella robusta]|uniref:Reverse transcriptase domain-containing protein n=1 Tax=Helobdella robusta TaxID=6412 RepID=T1G4B2_HELRO